MKPTEFEEIIETISRKVRKTTGGNERELYMGDDGYYHCAKCKKAVQLTVEFMGIPKVVWCICKCDEDEMEQQKRERQREEHERRRSICFTGSDMHGWTFEKDDRQSPKISDAMQKYADNFIDYLHAGRGLLLMGNCGTGKTFYAACIANRLIDKGYRCLVTNFARLSNDLQGIYEGKQRYIDSLQQYDLLVLDDLGAERKSEYMQEIVWNIIDARYRSGLPFIVTTNMAAEEIKSPDDIARNRIYDRIIERCFPVVISGQSRRKKSSRDNFAEMRQNLGL